MTIIRFEYKTNYHMPATGGLVFMPHRKHAANETEILPKPFHTTLVDGVVEVDLEPTGDDWVWSVTLDDDTRFYAIPDHDGIITHTDLIPIAPSTLDHRVEPAWWAELRQHQQFIADYVNESRSSVREAIDTVNSVHDTLTTAVADAQRHESVAGAYSRQAQASATSAWEASKGPDGAAQRAKDEADRAEIYRNEANTHRIAASGHETRAKEHADLSVETYGHILEFTEGWDSLEDAIVEAKTEADRSQTEADRATTEADRAQTHADRSEAAADDIAVFNIANDNGSITIDHDLYATNNHTIGAEALFRKDNGALYDADTKAVIRVGTQYATAQNPPGYSSAEFVLIDDNSEVHPNFQGEATYLRLISNRVLINRRLEINMGSGHRATFSSGSDAGEQVARIHFHSDQSPNFYLFGSQHQGITTQYAHASKQSTDHPTAVIDRANFRIESTDTRPFSVISRSANDNRYQEILFNQQDDGNQSIIGYISGSTAGSIEFSEDRHLNLYGHTGITLKDHVEIERRLIKSSPNGSKWRIEITDDGQVTATPHTP